MSIFLTGGTGFIGGHLVKRLSKIGYPVSCLVRKSNALLGLSNVNLVMGDLKLLCNRDIAFSLLRGHDYVIHCAAIRGEMRLPWSEYYEINVEATCSLLDAAFQAGIKKFVYLSSVGVLGTMPLQLPANEDTPYNPDCFYHKSKMLAEKKVIEFSQKNGLDAVVIRPSITYGPGDNGFFSRVTRLAARGFFPVVSGGLNKIHLTYIGGLVDAIIKVLNVSSGSSKVYTIVDAYPIRFKELVEIIAGTLNRKVRFINIPSQTMLILGSKAYDILLGSIRKGSSLTMSAKILSLPWYYDSSRAQKELSYKPFDTREQISKTLSGLNLTVG